MNQLTVAKVVEADRAKVCELAKLAHEESLFADIPFSPTKFYRALEHTITEPDTYLGLKASLGDDIVGFCYALFGSYYIGDGANVVTVITIATSPKVRTGILGGKAALRLTKGVEIWAKTKGASHVLYHATSGTNPIVADRFFRKLGMTTLGGNYAMQIKAD